MSGARRLVIEAVATARSQPVASTLTALTVAAMILAVMLTTGRTVAAEAQVLASIDSVGTRSITIRAEAAAGLGSDVLERIRPIQGIEWSAALSPATDATNALNLDGARVPVRFAYGDDFDAVGIRSDAAASGDLAYASPPALERLGLLDGTGAIELTGGAALAVVGPLASPDFLADFEPLVLVPRPADADGAPVSILIVIADRPDLVGPVSEAVASLLAAEDPTKLTIHTSETLAELRSLVEGQLGAFSRSLVLVLLGVTAAIVAVLLSGLVTLRRKDYGRRRALGATRGLIVTLLLVQTAVLASVGIAVGLLASAATMVSLRDPLPGVAFIAALAVLALATALLAALPPALLASRREPIRELRVP